MVCFIRFFSSFQALSVLERMKLGGVKRTLAAFNSALIACAKVQLVLPQRMISYDRVQYYGGIERGRGLGDIEN